MTRKNNYGEWQDHPRWTELCKICGNIERSKHEAEKLRELIRKEVYG